MGIGEDGFKRCMGMDIIAHHRIQILAEILQMHSKIYKAKLISIHTAQHTQHQADKQKGRQPIHAYFGMLQHIFQRNKHMIKQLKLSGTKIQNRKDEDSKVGCRNGNQSELFRSKNRLQKQKGQRKQQISRQKSTPNCTLIYHSRRNRSVQPRHTKQIIAQKDQPFMTQVEMFQFIPLGQASQRNLFLSNRSLHQNQEQNQSIQQQRGIKLNFTHDNWPNPQTQYKQHMNRTKKLSLKLNRRACRIKTQMSQAKTNYTSIRTTQNSNKQTDSAINLPVSPLEVTPW